MLPKPWELLGKREEKLKHPLLLKSHVATTTSTNVISLWLVKHLGKCCASFNRSLILPTWFIHVATADIMVLINHAVRNAGRPCAQAGLTNLNTIFHLNNLALPQGMPTPDSARWREPVLILLFLSLWAQRFFAACRSRQTLPCVLPSHFQPRAIMRNCFIDIRETNLV